MQKMNELLNSGKINAIEYYNYFKNRSACDATKTATHHTRPLPLTTSSNQKQRKQSSIQTSSPNSNRVESKFNQYLMKNVQISTQQQQGLSKKDDAINRIIRNERIKQIRNKINEFELLKEYQKFDDQPTGSKMVTSLLGDTFDTMSVESDYGFIDDDFNEDQLKKIKRSISYCDYLFSSDDNYRDTDEAEQQDDMVMEADVDSSISCKLNDSSIDDLMSLASFKSNQSLSTNSVNTRPLKSVKPGHELYQIGNLSSSSQSTTFQLKVSIIGAELKNVVNVLKQVCVYGVFYFKNRLTTPPFCS
jgi:hypothetical protein